MKRTNLYTHPLFSTAILLLAYGLLGGCNARTDKETGFDPDIVYQDYLVMGEEGNDNLTVLLRFRPGAEDEDPVNAAGKDGVTLDGEVLPPQTTSSGDVFYEIHKPIESFTGKHEIVFKDHNGTVHTNAFDFQPIRLLTEVPDTIQRGDLLFVFEGVEKDGHIRVLLTDTSFINDGVNRLEKGRDGQVLIPAAALEKLANGPVQLQFTRELQRDLDKNSAGWLKINYTLKRDFILVDSL